MMIFALCGVLLLPLVGLSQGFQPFQPYRGDIGAREMPVWHTVGGTITGPSPEVLGQLRVELVELRSRQTRYESMVTKNGLFTLTQVPMGEYELRVVSLMGAVLYSQEIEASQPGHRVIVLAVENRGVAPMISLRRLEHKVPRAAMGKFNKAGKLHKKGKTEEALLLLKEALELDPDYYDALATYGAVHLLRQQYATAIEYLEKAYAMDPNDALVAANLATAHLLAKGFAEAEGIARATLRQHPGDARTRYLLAVSLLQQNRGHHEAEAHLAQAAKEIPEAQAVLVRLRTQVLGQGAALPSAQ